MEVLLAMCLCCATLAAQETSRTTEISVPEGWAAHFGNGPDCLGQSRTAGLRTGFLLFNVPCGGEVTAREADSAISPFELGLPDFDGGSSASAGAPQSPTARPKAITYSNGYYTRRKVHVYASYATLPLFIAESVVGQELYNQTASGSLRSTHSALAAGIGVLFGVNTVTGVSCIPDSF